MAERRLRISDDLALPLEFATEGVAVIGKRGSGKSNTEARFVELLYEAAVPFAVVDPKGDWYGIKSSRDGKTPGLSVPVFGGLYGDFPLDERTGARIADLLVDEMLSAVLDVSHLSKTGGLPTFLTAFCNQLMHRHQLEPHVRTVILEEAHRYIPQSVTAKSAALKEAAASLLLEGRAFGLGCWAATQRPARLHKDVLEEVGTAIIHAIGVSATNDKRTIAGWVDHHDMSKEIVDSLTVLRPGEAWVLIPQDGLVKRVQMQRRTTFDSAATPKVGQAPRRPSTMADVDQAAITRALTDVIERAKRDDPKELQKRIGELERELAAKPAEQVVQEIVKEIEVPVLNGEVETLLEVVGQFRMIGEKIADVGDRVVAAIDRVTNAKAVPARSAPPVRPVADVQRRPVPESRPAPVQAVSAPRPTEGETRLKAGARRMLVALAQVHPRPLSRQQLSFLADVKIGGTFTDYLRSIVEAGYAFETGAKEIALTDAGVDQVRDQVGAGAPGRDELIALYSPRLKAGARRMLEVLLDRHPDTLARAELSELADVRIGGTFTDYLRSLTSNRLAAEDVGGIGLSDELFLGEGR
ncbi:MAG TPA: hypothetical protein VEW95_09270 [Candidatus Limnocylindrales bacterium]|nr:hypothetical protein [Candidatus Limnocylindrales bacterium]